MFGVMSCGKLFSLNVKCHFIYINNYCFFLHISVRVSVANGLFKYLFFYHSPCDKYHWYAYPNSDAGQWNIVNVAVKLDYLTVLKLNSQVLLGKKWYMHKISLKMQLRPQLVKSLVIVIFFWNQDRDAVIINYWLLLYSYFTGKSGSQIIVSALMS